MSDLAAVRQRGKVSPATTAGNSKKTGAQLAGSARREWRSAQLEAGGKAAGQPAALLHGRVGAGLSRRPRQPPASLPHTESQPGRRQILAGAELSKDESDDPG